MRKIKLKPEVVFVPHDGNLVVISATKYKWLKANWVQPLHQKLFPILRDGCSESQLLDSIDEKRRNIVKSYLKALKQCGALVSQNEISENGKTDFLQVPDEQNSSLKFNGLIAENDDRTACLCSIQYDSLLPALNHLLAVKKYRSIVFLLSKNSADTSVLLSETLQWLKNLLYLPTDNFRELSIYSMNDGDDFECKLKFKRSLLAKCRLIEVFEKTGIIFPHPTTSQLPLVFAAKADTGFLTSEIAVGLNYRLIAADLAIRETVRQLLLSEQSGSVDENAENPYQNILTSASKTELQAAVMDQIGRRIQIEKEVETYQFDGLELYKHNPEIHYLQSILRTRFTYFPVSERRFEPFFRFAADSLNAVSICREKALFNLLLKVVSSEFYSLEKLDSEYYFYSRFSSFVRQFELRRTIKKARLKLLQKYSLDVPFINKISTYWGDFFWVELENNN